ncbi:MAG: SH3 domain-containing protein [Agathobacter sp.]|nr:SH3 domain-containing protein [Agathobacter sp.]
MQSFLDKIKGIFNKDKFGKAGVFFVENKRYFAAALLFVILVLVLKFGTNPKNMKDNQIADTQKPQEENNGDFSFDIEFENDSNDAIKELLEKYYEAYAQGDTAELEKVATPVSDNEKSYISVLSKYYEKIMNITYYSKQGPTDGSYFVSVRNDIKFYDVDSTAPALDFFYVETNADGKLFINNLYSIYNLNFAENPMDSDIYTLIQQYMQQEDFEKLQGKVQVAYNEAISGDEKLAKMLQETIDTAIREWAATIRPVKTEENTEESTEKGTEASTQKDTETEKDTETQKDTETEKDTETQKDTEQDTQNNTQESESKTSKVKTIDIVNVRAAASADAELLGKLTDGVVLTKLGEEGEWTIVEYSGGKDGKGYIKTEFLEAVK